MTGTTAWHGFSYAPGPIDVQGAVFDDFRLTDHLPPDEAPVVIERDRLIMAARPGFNRKLLPLRLDPANNTAFSGGRYLLDTYDNAIEFARWIAEDFAIDGTLILDRPDFADVSAQVFRVIGAHDFQPLESHQHVSRVERFRTTSSAHAWLEKSWVDIRNAADSLELASVWLLDNPEQAEAALVTVADSLQGASPAELDFASIRHLEQMPSLLFDAEKGGQIERVFDRTSWVFTIWRPYREGEQNEPALWPNSPPLPALSALVDSAA